MTQTNGRAVLWDLDGTILDSRDAHWQAWRTFTIALGRPMSYAVFDETFGSWNEAVLRRHFGPHLTSDEVTRLADEKEALYRKLLLEGGVEPLPGVTDWLAAFQRDGWKQALGSMAPRANIEVTLAALGIGGYFSAVVSGEDVRQGKPSPDVFLAAARALSAVPARCVVIEDSPQGVAAARAAGMKSIAVGPQSAALGADLALTTLAAADPAAAAELLR